MTLKEATIPYMTNLVTGLAGGALGGGLGHFSTHQTADESPEEFESRRRSNTISGGLAGGVAGASLPELGGLFKRILTPSDPSVADHITGAANPVKHPFTTAPVEGAVAGAAGGAVIGRVAQGTIPGKPGPLTDKLTGLDGEIQNAQQAWDRVVSNADSEVAMAKARFEAGGKVPASPEHGLYEAAIHDRDALNQTLAAGHVHEPAQRAITEAQAARDSFKSLMDQNEAMPWYRKFISSQTEKDLLHAGAPRSAFRPRTGARWGMGVGAAAAPIINYYLGNH